MTIIDVLRTQPRERKRVVRNKEGKRMSFPQIQFTSDCIRRYAANKGLHLDEAFDEVQKAGGMSIIGEMYAQSPTMKIGCAVKALERKMDAR